MHNSGNFQKLLEPKFRKIFFDTYDELPEQYPEIYNVGGSKKAKEYDYHVSGTGEWEEKTPGGPIAEEEIDHGQEVTYIHKAYAKMITIERELIDDDQYDVIEKLPKKMARGARATVERLSAAPLNNGFSVNGYDGVPLFSDSHPLLHSSSLLDNLMPASALSDANLKIGMTMMRTNMLTQEGLKMQASAKRLIVPADLEFTALTILHSIGQAGTPNNDTNVIKGKLKPVVLDYLTDTNAWFLQDPVISEFNFFWRVKPEFKSTENFDNMVAKYRGYLRFSCGYSDVRGWIGNAGA
jgi:phage major head subunit gpT-like protein